MYGPWPIVKKLEECRQEQVPKMLRTIIYAKLYLHVELLLGVLLNLLVLAQIPTVTRCQAHLIDNQAGVDL